MSTALAISAQLELPEDIDRTFDGIVVELAKRGADVDLTTYNYAVHILGKPQPHHHEFYFDVVVTMPRYEPWGGGARAEIIVEGRGETPFDALIQALWRAYNQNYSRIEWIQAWFR